MLNVGKIFIPRRIRDHWLWHDAKKYLRWNDLVMEAAWQPMPAVFGNSRFMLQRGQLVTSVRLLMHRWGTNSRYVTDFLTLLEAESMISCERTRTYTIITIIGYDEDQRGADNGNYGESPPPESADPQHKRLHQERREGSPLKEDNNINNKTINSSSIPVEELNQKFAESIKENDLAIDRAMVTLRCDKEKVLELLELFVNDVNFSSKRHADFSDFSGHFINWSREFLRKEKKYGNGKTKQTGSGGNAQDKYAARRGVDAKDHTAEDYGDTF